MQNFLKKIWNIFKQKYGQILLGLLLLIVFIVSIKSGKYLLSNDNYSPELNPLMSTERYLQSPAWRGYRVLGFASDSEQADIFRSTMFAIGELFLPKWTLAQFYSLACLCIGVLSMATLVSYFIRDFVNTKNSGYVFFLSGLIYLSTLWTAWVFNFNMMPYIAQYGFLPLLLLAIYMYMKDLSYTRGFLLLLASIFFVSSSVIGTLFFVNLVLIGLAFIYFGWLHRVKIKGILKGFWLFILVQFFWLLPFMQYTVSTSGDVIGSYTNRSITANTIDLEKQMMTLPNSARMYTRLLGTVDNPDDNSYIFPASSLYMEYDFYKVVGLIPILLSIIGLVFTIFQKKYKLIPLWIILFGILFLLKNQNPPLGGIYLWLQETFGLFKQVFRWVSSKLGQQYVVILSMTGTIGFVLILNFLSSFFKNTKRYIFILFSLAIIILPLFFYSEYLFQGDLFTQRATVSLPEQYYDLKEYLKDDTLSRIYYAPPSNNGYFREYDWGFVGSQFISYIIPNPVMDMSLAIGSDVGEQAMWEIRNAYDSGDVKQFSEKLEKYDVEYVLVDKSLVKGRYGHSIDWEAMDSYVLNFEKVWSEDFLSLYKFERKDEKYVETLGSQSSLASGSFVRDFQKEPRLLPMNFDFNRANFSNGELVKNIEYSGNPTNLYSKISSSEINEAPIHVQQYNNKIRITPALPTLNDLENTSYKEFEIDSYEERIYIIGENVIDSSVLKEGINLTTKYGDISELYFVKKSSMNTTSYTTPFSNSSPGNCSGDEFTILPDIQKEYISSGFKITGHTDLPCVYQNIRLDKRITYVGSIDINWEPADNTVFGYCLYSSTQSKCLNSEKFFYSDKGYGVINTTIPVLIQGGDDLSLSLYALNHLGEKISLTVRDVKLNLSGEIEMLPLSEESVDTQQKVLELGDGKKTITVRIPILHGEGSYVYSQQFNEGAIWETNKAEDGLLTYDVSNDGGMKQKVQNQLLNQYKNIFNKTPVGKYLWYWEGENVENLPANLCLTYQGSDRCWIDDTFYDGQKKSVTQIFSSPQRDLGKLDASYNSMSFSNESENILNTFIVMKIPEVWNDIMYKASLEDQYTEVELTSNDKHGSRYSLDSNIELGRNTLVSIPQAKSKYWLAIGNNDGRLEVLGKEQRVSINGWKQAWDTNSVDYSEIFVIYWPNLLSYFGYGIILIVSGYFVFKLFRERKYVK